MHSTVGSIGSVTGTLNFVPLFNSAIEVAVGDGNTNKILTDGFLQYSGYTVSSTVHECLDYSQSGFNMSRSVGTSYDTYYLTIMTSKDNLLVHGVINIKSMY